MKTHGVTHDELEFRSGVLRNTLKTDRNSKIPTLRSIEAWLGSFRWELVAVPSLSSLPEDVREKLGDIGRMLRADLGNEVVEAATAAVLHRDRREAPERAGSAG